MTSSVLNWPWLPPSAATSAKSLYRMVGTLTALGVTVMMSVEVVGQLYRPEVEPPRHLLPHRHHRHATLLHSAAVACAESWQWSNTAAAPTATI